MRPVNVSIQHDLGGIYDQQESRLRYLNSFGSVDDKIRPQSNGDYVLFGFVTLFINGGMHCGRSALLNMLTLYKPVVILSGYQKS